MGRTILCPHCKSALNEDILKQRNSMDVCLVCGESLLDNANGFAGPKKEKHTYYYYKEGGGMLDDTLSSYFTPLYTFEAVDMQDAERQLKEVLPNSPLVNENIPEKVRCPRCRSTDVQLIPKKFSLLTGFTTNKYERMCIRCKKKF